MPAAIRFLHFSDLHLRLRAQKGDKLSAVLTRNIRPLDLVRRALCEGAALHPAFVLLTGDLADNGGAREYAALRALLRETLPGVPAVCVPGNHDARGAFRAHLLGVPADAPLDRVFWFDGLRVAALDTGADGVITPGQVAWLEKVLRSPAPRGTLLALHHPLLRQSPMEPARYPPSFASLAARGGLRGIFCGHTHENRFGSFAGVPYVTADACSFRVEEQAGQPFCLPCAGYVLVDLGETELSVQMKRAATHRRSAARFPI